MILNNECEKIVNENDHGLILSNCSGIFLEGSRKATKILLSG
jgi:hypothetical protein